MALGGSKPKPTALKLIMGNPGKRPLPENEPEIPALADIPEAPDFLYGDGLKEWNRQVEHLQKCGILTFVDIPALAAFCQLYGRWVQAERSLALHLKLFAADMDNFGQSGLVTVTPNGAMQQHPLVGVANTAARDMIRYASELGITPSARSRVKAAPQGNKTSPASKYLG